jgi:mono/diheme cytochrome c family protein
VPRTGIPHRHKAWWIATGAGALVVFGATVAMVILLSGAYSTSATKQHFWITYRILELGLRYSVAASARGIVVPDLERVANLDVGHACYRQHCLQCHGAPGVAPEGLGRGELPPPSSLSQPAREWPTAHLFFVVQKGIRMSGMPAWEYRMSEEALWSTVAYLKAMPFQSREAYERFAAASEEASCPPADRARPYSIEQAQTTLRQYACDTCHMIDNMVGAYTHVGPPLEAFYKRKFIAGVLPNTPENLVRWIMEPQSVSPHTLMPDLEVTEPHARTMARYLLQTPE